jgi:DNA modification methylase
VTYACTYQIGDCLEVLRTIPDQTFHCCVTSPPYWGLRDYGHEGQIGLEETLGAYVERMVEVFSEVRRTLRDDGTLWLNLGDSYAGSWGNQGRKKERGLGLKPKDLVGIPWRVAFALQADGWWLRSDIIWHKPNPMPESITDRPTRAHEYIFLLAKSERYYYDADAIKEDMLHPSAMVKSGFGGKKRNGGKTYSGNAYNASLGGRNKRDVWTVTTKPYRGAHFAVFPPDLIKPCVLAGCPEGGIVLDPFFGSGTTGQVAEQCGRAWFGVELNPEYETLIRERTAQRGLFVGAL